MSNQINLKLIKYLVASTILGILLILLSESTKFSHLNLLPMGGRSWALWLYPLSFSICFAGMGFYMKIKNWQFISVAILILLSFIFYVLTGGTLFDNLTPFG